MTLFGRIVIPIVAVLTAVAAITLLLRPVRMMFASPRQAAEQLVVALRAGDVNTAEIILGPGSAVLISSGDNLMDQQMRRRFVAAYDRRLSLSSQTPSRLTLLLGTDDWPFPIPLVKKGDGWGFNSGAGIRELLARRIGRDEMDAIKECRAFVDAEREYASIDHGEGVLDYAQRLTSTPGRQNGLYWQAEKGSPPSPLGPAFAHAEAGQGQDAAIPYNGYYFKILPAQGPSARDGAYSYLAHGRMIGGFSLIAFPARYGSTGIMSFIVNDDDVVFEKDLGTGTRTIAARTTLFDPGPGWLQTRT